MNHSLFMQRAIALAKKGKGWTNPNPIVGCVIVRDGQIVAEGYHQRYGEWHAERNAILSYQGDLTGTTAYVTLEPCCHHGRTPPCSALLIEKGISTVVIGSRDPNPLVSGQGVQALLDAGITVIQDVLKDECDKLNPIFFHYIQTKRPYVLMKYAMTADGKIATCGGESKWITSEVARKFVQQTRHEYSAIMVGVETLLADDPMLNCRLPDSKQPIRIICDSNLRTPLTSQLVATAKQYRTLIATINTNEKQHQAYQQYGVEILVTKANNKRVDFADLLQKLGQLYVDSLLVEGGATLNFSLLESGLVNRVHCYIAPKLVGGVTAKTPIGGVGIEQLCNAIKLKQPTVSLIGDDILLDYEVIN